MLLKVQLKFIANLNVGAILKQKGDGLGGCCCYRRLFEVNWPSLSRATSTMPIAKGLDASSRNRPREGLPG